MASDDILIANLERAAERAEKEGMEQVGYLPLEQPRFEEPDVSLKRPADLPDDLEPPDRFVSRNTSGESVDIRREEYHYRLISDGGAGAVVYRKPIGGRFGKFLERLFS